MEQKQKKKKHPSIILYKRQRAFTVKNKDGNNIIRKMSLSTLKFNNISTKQIR